MRIPAALAIVVALAGVPAAAHGPGEPREVDARVLLDDDGLLGYGGCGLAEESGAPCSPDPAGLDLLALEAREAWLGDAPAVVLRIVAQPTSDRADVGLEATFLAAGAPREVVMARDSPGRWSGTGVDEVRGPLPAGDGHPLAVEAWMRLASLGVAAGDALTEVVVRSTVGGEDDDVMPGIGYRNGVLLPHVPHSPDPGEAVEEPEPGAYTLNGPAPLLQLQPASGVLDGAATGTVLLRLRNPLGQTAQDVGVTAAPEGVVALRALRASPPAVDGAAGIALRLGPGEEIEVEAALLPGAGAGNVTVLATSDLGGRSVADLQALPAPATDATSTQPAGRDAPALGMALAPALALAAALRRWPSLRPRQPL